MGLSVNESEGRGREGIKGSETVGSSLTGSRTVRGSLTFGVTSERCARERGVSDRG